LIYLRMRQKEHYNCKAEYTVADTASCKIIWVIKSRDILLIGHEPLKIVYEI